MRRWVKVLLAGLVVLIALLVLNAIAVTNETKDAERNVEGAELVETSSGTLQVLEEGDPEGSPIVLLHGATRVDATGSRSWARCSRARHRVIRLDLLGHGGSDKPGAGYEMSRPGERGRGGAREARRRRRHGRRPLARRHRSRRRSPSRAPTWSRGS